MTTRTETLAAGESFFIEGGGRFFQCHYATTEIEFRVTVGGNRYDWAPLDRGIGWREVFETIEVRNPTDASQTVTVVHHTLSGYFDQRELAAQIAVDGGIVTNTAPSIDLGGSVLKVGNSKRDLTFDQTGEGDGNIEIIGAAENTGGIRIRHLEIMVTETSGAEDSAARLLVAYSPLAYLKTFFWKTADAPQAYSYDKTLDLVAGARLEMFLREGDKIIVRLNFDHL